MNRKHHSGVFMMEMISVVFFFILCAGICIQTFVKADSMSREASDLNQAVLIAQSVAEVFKEGASDGLKKQFGAEEEEDGGLLLTFDRNGRPQKGGTAVFTVLVSVSDQERAQITVSRADDGLYQLLVSRHQKEGRVR